VTAAANEEVLKNELLMTLLGYGTILLVVFFTYRSLVAALLALVPLLLANFANAYMGWRGIGLNLQTLPVIIAPVWATAVRPEGRRRSLGDPPNTEEVRRVCSSPKAIVPRGAVDGGLQVARVFLRDGIDL
jgi:hypothetical protein